MKRAVPVIVAIVVLAIALIVLVPLFRNSSPHASGPSGLAGTTAPVFSLGDDRGATVSLAQYRGKLVVMNLWASWCPPCRAEMPDLQRLSSAYAARGVQVVGVNEGEAAQRASAFAASLGIHFPIWLDADQRYGRLYAALGLPTTVVIGRSGVVLKGFDGPLTFDQMQAAVKPYLSKS